MAKTYLQPKLDSTSEITIKKMTGGIGYVTTAPTADNTDGIKIVVLSSAPQTKYNGWLYIITDNE